MNATIQFNTKESGFISSGDQESRENIAKYPEAPAWPTEEYKVATQKNNTLISKMDSKGSNFLN